MLGHSYSTDYVDEEKAAYEAKLGIHRYGWPLKLVAEQALDLSEILHRRLSPDSAPEAPPDYAKALGGR